MYFERFHISITLQRCKCRKLGMVIQYWWYITFKCILYFCIASCIDEIMNYLDLAAVLAIWWILCDGDCWVQRRMKWAKKKKKKHICQPADPCFCCLNVYYASVEYLYLKILCHEPILISSVFHEWSLQYPQRRIQHPVHRISHHLDFHVWYILMGSESCLLVIWVVALLVLPIDNKP